MTTYFPTNLESYTEPVYINATESVDNFVSCTRQVLQHWNDLHVNADAWVNEWLGLNYQTIKEAWEQEIKFSNDYFNFDWKYHSMKYYSFKTNMFEQCSVCGAIFEYSYFDCDCEGAKSNEPSQEYLLEYMLNCEYYIPPEDCMLKAAYEAFDSYRDAIHPMISYQLDDVSMALDRFSDAETNQDLFMCAIATLGIMHHSGNICEDYGDSLGLEYNDVCSVREDGIVSLFTSEQVKKYINETEE